jgi:hypothetical protein
MKTTMELIGPKQENKMLTTKLLTNGLKKKKTKSKKKKK